MTTLPANGINRQMVEEVNYPANNISKDDAKAYIDKINEQQNASSKCIYRLPTYEEYLVGAGGQGPARWDPDAKTARNYWSDPQAGSGGAPIFRVGGFRRTPTGILDPTGVVRVWVTNQNGELGVAGAAFGSSDLADKNKRFGFTPASKIAGLETVGLRLARNCQSKP